MSAGDCLICLIGWQWRKGLAMGTETRQYARGTSVTMAYPFGRFVSARALCSDGKVRAARVSDTADTFFSVPARVSVRGRTVSGFITWHGDDTDAYVIFRAYTYGRNGKLLGEGHECDAPSVVTCGNCNRSWCEAHDPAPSALCHYCNGRGHSLAPVRTNA